MRFFIILFFLSLIVAKPSCNAQSTKQAELTVEAVNQLISFLEAKGTGVYGAVYYPIAWKDQMNGLKPVTVEAIADLAGEQIKSRKVKLELASNPVHRGRSGAVLLKRSGTGFAPGLFKAYLYLDDKNRWGFLGFPIPYKSSVIRDSEEIFKTDSLNSATPYDGPLYEFDESTKKIFADLCLLLDAELKKAGQAVGSKLP